MDDLEFRRQAYTDPECKDSDFIEHKNKSADNNNFVEDLQLLDESLKQAMTLQPPEDLAERIKLNQTLRHHQVMRKRTFFWSMAASVLIVFTVFFTLQPVNLSKNSISKSNLSENNLSENNLEQQVLSHIYHEIDHLYEKQDRSLNQVNVMLAEFGSHLNSSIGSINYLGSCDIAKKKGVHMVVEGSIGPITVMMLPDSPVTSQQLINDKRFKGLIMPAGKGSMAVLGEKGESLKLLQEKLIENIRWI